VPAVIAVVLIAIVALAVLSVTVHVLFFPGCSRPSPSRPGSSSGRAAPAGNPRRPAVPPSPADPEPPVTNRCLAAQSRCGGYR
jgi:hypothetical protein